MTVSGSVLITGSSGLAILGNPAATPTTVIALAPGAAIDFGGGALGGGSDISLYYSQGAGTVLQAGAALGSAISSGSTAFRVQNLGARITLNNGANWLADNNLTASFNGPVMAPAVLIGGGNGVASLITSGSTVLSGTVTFVSGQHKVTPVNGSGSWIGTGVLVSGRTRVSSSLVTAQSVIFLQDTTTGVLTNTGELVANDIYAGVSFAVSSSNVADTSTFNWMFYN